MQRLNFMYICTNPRELYEVHLETGALPSQLLFPEHATKPRKPGIFLHVAPHLSLYKKKNATKNVILLHLVTAQARTGLRIKKHYKKVTLAQT